MQKCSSRYENVHLLSGLTGPPMSPMSGGGASDTPNAEKFIEPEKEPHYDGHWTMLRMLIVQGVVRHT